MSKIDDGGPVFPEGYMLDTGQSKQSVVKGGMSLRDYFAGQSIMGTIPGCKLDDNFVQDRATMAYRMADSMIKARKK